MNHSDNPIQNDDTLAVNSSDLRQYITANYIPVGRQKDVPYQEHRAGTSGRAAEMQTRYNEKIRFSLSDTEISCAEALYSALDNDRPFNRSEAGLPLTFSDELRNTMIEKGLNSTDVYYAAGVDRKLFSKILNNSQYAPKKDTCIALCIGLKLTLEEARELLSRAGYALSHASMRDVIIEYFFARKIWSLNTLNIKLTEYGEKPLAVQFELK